MAGHARDLDIGVPFERGAIPDLPGSIADMDGLSGAPHNVVHPRSPAGAIGTGYAARLTLREVAHVPADTRMDVDHDFVGVADVLTQEQHHEYTVKRSLFSGVACVLCRPET